MPLMVILAITVLVFQRAFVSGFVEWDDNVFVTANPLLNLPISEFLPPAWQ